jgi:BASS family bile acid:Na+ symporter
MTVLEAALDLSVVIFTAGSLLGLGLTVAPRALLPPLKDRHFIVLTLVLGWIVCPLLARVLLQLIPLDRPYAAGLLMLALAPAAPFAPAMMERARADPAYVAGFMVLAAAGTVAFMPVGVPLLIEGVRADPMTLARPLLLLVLLPMVIGLATRQISPRVAERARRGIAALTNAVGAMLLVFVVFLYGSAVLNAVGSYAIITQTLFIVVGTLVAQAAGVGLRDERRSVITLGMCSRNLGAALAPLAAVERDPRALVMVVGAAPLTLIVSLLAARWLARDAARHRSAELA